MFLSELSLQIHDMPTTGAVSRLDGLKIMDGLN